MHEWGYGVVFALGVAKVGLSFFMLFTLIFAFACLALVLHQTVATRRHIVAGAVLSLLAGMVYGIRLISPRPTGMSLLFVLVCARLVFQEKFDRRHAIGVIALELVWANAHGSFPLGILIIAVAALWDRQNRRLLSITALGALLVTVINPYGLRLHALVVGYFLGTEGTYAAIYRHVHEFAPVWRQPTAGESAGEIARLGLIALACLRAASFPKARGRVALCLLLVPLAARSARHIELVGLLTCMLLAPYLDEALDQRWQAPPIPVPPRALLALALVPGFVAGILANLLAKRERSAADWVNSAIGGTEIVRLVDLLPQDAHVYAPFQSAGLVMWLGHAKHVRVFYDSRNDCYSNEVIEAFFRLAEPALPARQAVDELEKRGTTAVLVRDSHPLHLALGEAPSWRSASDSGWTLWMRPVEKMEQ
jgi:hypothetical protein